MLLILRGSIGAFTECDLHARNFGVVALLDVLPERGLQAASAREGGNRKAIPLRLAFGN